MGLTLAAVAFAGLARVEASACAVAVAVGLDLLAGASLEGDLLAHGDLTTDFEGAGLAALLDGGAVGLGVLSLSLEGVTLREGVGEEVAVDALGNLEAVALAIAEVAVTAAA